MSDRELRDRVEALHDELTREQEKLSALEVRLQESVRVLRERKTALLQRQGELPALIDAAIDTRKEAESSLNDARRKVSAREDLGPVITFGKDEEGREIGPRQFLLIMAFVVGTPTVLVLLIWLLGRG